jgi:hypothetical protein
MKAQQTLAEVQKQVKAIVIKSGKVNGLRWELDKNWISQQGYNPQAFFNPHISPGSGILGQTGKVDWSITRGSIAVAMVQGRSTEIRSQIVPKTG